MIITAERFFRAYVDEFSGQPAWPDDIRARTKFAKKAAELAIKNIDLQLADANRTPGNELILSREYFKVDVIAEEKVGDRDTNWMLRVAFEHENPGWYRLKENERAWGAPVRRPYWLQELCKLTHLFADLRVLATYHDEADGDLTELLQRNIKRMQDEDGRMTRVKVGQWLFIFGMKRANLFRGFTLSNHNNTAPVELSGPATLGS